MKRKIFTRICLVVITNRDGLVHESVYISVSLSLSLSLSTKSMNNNRWSQIKPMNKIGKTTRKLETFNGCVNYQQVFRKVTHNSEFSLRIFFPSFYKKEHAGSNSIRRHRQFLQNVFGFVFCITKMKHVITAHLILPSKSKQKGKKSRKSIFPE